MREWLVPFILLVVIFGTAFLVDTLILEPRRQRAKWRDWFANMGMDVRKRKRKRRDKDG